MDYISNMKNNWNNRYSTTDYFFGKEPNDFFKKEIDKLTPGKAVFIGDGEGRNSVYAATLGWQVDSIDISEIGKQKANKLAEEKKVKINYLVTDALQFDYGSEKYDLIAIIYFHVERELREKFELNILNALKHKGSIILLVYDQDHLKNKSNGPQNINVLYTLKDIAENFIDLDFKLLEKKHVSRIKKDKQQKSTIIKFVGTKF